MEESQIKKKLEESDKRVSDLKDLIRSSNSPCPEFDEDCSEVLSPCCEQVVTTVFGTLPLKVECSNCKKQYILRDLI